MSNETPSKRVPLSGKTPTTPNGSTPTDNKKENGQYEDYWVLSQKELDKGYTQPFRDSYIHNFCGGLTKMSHTLSATYARNPKFYGATFCCSCGDHFPVSEFKWDNTDVTVGDLVEIKEEPPLEVKDPAELIDISDDAVKDRYLQTLHNSLAWAMDMIDMYDERLASIDGEKMVYTEVHKETKEIARAVLKNALNLKLVKEESCLSD